MAKEPNYWRSFEELHRQSSGKVNESSSREFVEGTFDELDLEKMTAVDRRKFLGLMVLQLHLLELVAVTTVTKVL